MGPIAIGRPIRVRGLVLAACLALAACSAPASPTAAPADSPTPAASPVAASPTAPPGSGGCSSTDDTSGVAVTIEGFAFDPDPVRATVGQAITWTNRDGAPHTATLSDPACTTDGLGKGASGSLVFDRAGTFSYVCRIHPDAMRGTIEITG
jgi:plastocyanin